MQAPAWDRREILRMRHCIQGGQLRAELLVVPGLNARPLHGRLPCPPPPERGAWPRPRRCWPHRRRVADSATRLGTQSEHPLPHAVPGWDVLDRRGRAGAVPVCSRARRTSGGPERERGTSGAAASHPTGRANCLIGYNPMGYSEPCKRSSKHPCSFAAPRSC